VVVIASLNLRVDRKQRGRSAPGEQHRGNMINLTDKPQTKKERRKKQKRTALVICRDATQFWTTQAQFWQWVRELKIVKVKDHPLTGKFKLPYEESMVVLGNAVLNLAHRNHLKEVLSSRRFIKPR
jgi:hypothetical protein